MPPRQSFISTPRSSQNWTDEGNHIWRHWEVGRSSYGADPSHILALHQESLVGLPDNSACSPEPHSLKWVLLRWLLEKWWKHFGHWWKLEHTVESVIKSPQHHIHSMISIVSITFNHYHYSSFSNQFNQKWSSYVFWRLYNNFNWWVRPIIWFDLPPIMTNSHHHKKTTLCSIPF